MGKEEEASALASTFTCFEDHFSIFVRIQTFNKF
jgi:hypothetical protein